MTFWMLGLFGGIALTQVPTVTDSGLMKQTSATAKEPRFPPNVWESAMRKTFATEKSRVVVDFSSSSFNISPFRLQANLNTNDLAMQITAGSLHRKVIYLKSGIALARTSDTSSTQSALYEQVLNWLTEIPEAKLQLLLSSGIPFASLDSATQSLMLRVSSLPGILQEIALDQFVSSEVRLTFGGRVKDKDGKTHAFMLSSPTGDSDVESERRNKLEASYVPPSRKSNAKSKASDGPFDESKGELAKVSSICSEASVAFGHQVNFDARIGDSYCYIQGRFGEKELVELLNAIATPIPFSVSPATKAEYLHALIELMRAKLPASLDPSLAPKTLTFEALLEGRSYVASDLFVAFPGLKKVIGRFGVGENTSITLTPLLTFRLVGKGSYVDPLDPPGSSPIANSFSATIGLFDDEY